MNEKEKIANLVIAAVIDSCQYEQRSITREELLSPERKGENVDKTRLILVSMLLYVGFSRESAATILNRSVSTITDMLGRALIYEASNFIYRIAYNEAKRKCSAIMEGEWPVISPENQG